MPMSFSIEVFNPLSQNVEREMESPAQTFKGASRADCTCLYPHQQGLVLGDDEIENHCNARSSDCVSNSSSGNRTRCSCEDTQDSSTAISTNSEIGREDLAEGSFGDEGSTLVDNNGHSRENSQTGPTDVADRIHLNQAYSDDEEGLLPSSRISNARTVVKQIRVRGIHPESLWAGYLQHRANERGFDRRDRWIMEQGGLAALIALDEIKDPDHY
ncbi:hypothetical protein PM082_007175 [Marasmius tenuissimus]|nr:hypothetical protein PM082_007175 [Marasmius tenuissimus]